VRGKACGILPSREPQHEPRGHPLQGKATHLPGARHHVAIEIVPHTAQPVHGNVIRVRIAHEPHLGVVTLSGKHLQRAGKRHLLADDGLVRGHDFPHASLDGLQFLGGQRGAPLHQAEKAAQRNGIVHRDPRFRIDLVEGYHQQESQRAMEDAHPVTGGHVEGRDVTIPGDVGGELAEAAVHQCGDDGRRSVRATGVAELLQRGTNRAFPGAPVGEGDLHGTARNGRPYGAGGHARFADFRGCHQRCPYCST